MPNICFVVRCPELLHYCILGQLSQQNMTPVAFTASLSKTLTNVGSDQHIVFDNVITNVGNAYLSSHGHFITPVKGVYIFFVSLTNVPEHSASAALIQNGQWIGHVLAHGSASNSGLYVTSTLASTVQLDIGDEVWVQNTQSFSDVEEIDGYNWSYFTGHLVNAN